MNEKDLKLKINEDNNKIQTKLPYFCGIIKNIQLHDNYCNVQTIKTCKNNFLTGKKIYLLIFIY